MAKIIHLGIFLMYACCADLNAQADVLFHGISFGDSMESTRLKLAGQVLDMAMKIPDSTRFPLAAQGEAHLVCRGLSYGKETVDAVVLTFADDRLALAQAHGNAYNTFIAERRDSADTYLGYRCYWNDRIFARPGEDKVWFLSREAMHPNLFLWDNPRLPVNQGMPLYYPASARLPEFFEMGGALETLRPVLEEKSDFFHELELDGSDPNAQIQLDCFGMSFAGFPRKFEARFGNGKLNMVWILTGKNEEDRLRRALIEAYGPVIFKNEAWEVFHNWQVLLRKDKPEVLILTPELGQHYKSSNFNQE